MQGTAEQLPAPGASRCQVWGLHSSATKYPELVSQCVSQISDIHYANGISMQLLLDGYATRRDVWKPKLGRVAAALSGEQSCRATWMSPAR